MAKPHHHIILSAYRDDAFVLNRMAQSSRKEAGLLGRNSLRIKGQKIYEGDRILFTRNSHQYGVKNGQFATVKAIKGKRIKVKIDGEQFKLGRLFVVLDLKM